MCKFKSGIILKSRVVLAPKGNESHQALLEKLGIEDNLTNAVKRFVRVELTPPNGNRAAAIEQWDYKVDQDVVPDWYEEDPKRYEDEMREAVNEYMKDELKNVICGYDWTAIKDENYTIYFMNGVMNRMRFGKNNNYAESDVAKYLEESQLLKDLKETFRDKLVPFSLDLTSIDGFKDYGTMENCILAIPNAQIIMKYGGDIPLVDETYWLATPNQTPSRGESFWMQYVCGRGYVVYGDCYWGRGVRPFFIIKS